MSPWKMTSLKANTILTQDNSVLTEHFSRKRISLSFSYRKVEEMLAFVDQRKDKSLRWRRKTNDNLLFD